jgi:membrane protein DedA with SNARE-associated domain
MNVIFTWGYLGILICMIFNGGFIPIPSYIILPFAGYLISTGKFDFFFVVFLSGMGIVVGSLVMYVLGKYASDPFLNKFGKNLLISKSDIENAQKWFHKFGNLVIFGGSLYPVFRTALSFTSGIMKVRYTHFTIYTFVGSLIWSAFLVFLGVQLGKYWPIIENYFLKFDLIASILLVILIIIFIIQTVKKYQDINEK